MNDIRVNWNHLIQQKCTLYFVIEYSHWEYGWREYAVELKWQDALLRQAELIIQGYGTSAVRIVRKRVYTDV